MRLCSTLMLAAFSLPLTGCDQPARQAPASLPPPAVTVSLAVEQESVDSVEFIGRAKAVDDVDIRGRVEGFPKERAFIEGQDVQAGDLLFLIEPDPSQADLDLTKAKLAQAEASLPETSKILERSQTFVKKAMSVRRNSTTTSQRSEPPRPKAQEPLSLEEAVGIALGIGDPTVTRHKSQAAALDEEAIADAQLPDPQLRLGFVNWPTDTFDYDQEQMTQIQVGAIQRFPHGNTLRFQQKRRRAEASGARAEAQLQELQIVHDVRWLWLELYYTDGTLKFVNESQDVVRNQIEAIESSFATGLQPLQDILRADLELDLLEDRAIDIERQADLLRANFARLVGDEVARRSIATRLPELGPIAPKDIITDALQKHPEILIEDQRISARNSEINIANEQYKPGWALEARYGARGGGEADFASLMVVMDVPLFTDKRQDKRLSAAKHEKQAAVLDRAAKLLDLKRQLDRAYADWLRYGERIQLFETVVVGRASDTAGGALDGYQNQTSDFAELIRAQLAELDTELQLLRLRVNRVQSEAGLLFLSGDRL